MRFERALALANKAARSRASRRCCTGRSTLLGELLLQLGRTHDALAAYREALDFAIDQPGHGTAWFGIASALRIMDRHEEALDALDRAESALWAIAATRRRAHASAPCAAICASRSAGSMPACGRTSRRTGYALRRTRRSISRERSADSATPTISAATC